MKNILLLSALLATACARSSGVLQIAPGTYTISIHAAPARGGEQGALRIALADATEHCASMGKEISTQNINSGASAYVPGGTVAITFRCVSRGDPELQRRVYQ